MTTYCYEKKCKEKNGSEKESDGVKSNAYKKEEEESAMKQKQANIEKMFDTLAQYERKEIKLDDTFKELHTFFPTDPSEWIKHVDEKGKRDIIEKLKHELDCDAEVLSRSLITDAEVVDNSSALKGIYLTKDTDDMNKLRQSMLKANRCIKFKGPAVYDRDIVEEFQTESQRDVFMKSLEANGLGSKIAINVAKPSAGISTGFEYKDQNKYEGKTKEHLSNFFFCRILCSVVPIAVWEPQLEDVSLDDNAIKKLSDIEHFLLMNKKDFAKDECQSFFHKFGSHVFLGNIHFGGMYKIETVFKSDNCSNLDLAKNIVKNRHAMSVNACKSVFGLVKLGAEVSGHTKSSLADESGKFEEEMSCNVHTKVTKIGGPQEVSIIPVWKNGLVAQNSTWRVVDTGEIETGELKGVWEFVMIQSSCFKEPTDLANFLSETWSDVTGIAVSNTILSRSKLLETEKKLKLEIDKIYSSFELNANSQTYVSGIEALYKYVSAICESDTSIWEKQLRENNHLTQIFTTIVNLKDPSIGDFNIRHYVEKLITLGRNTKFPNKNEIQLWLLQTKDFSVKSRFAIEPSSNIQAFCTAIDSFLKSVRLEKHRKQDMDSQINIKVEFAQAVVKMLSCLRQNRSICEYALLLAALLPMKYDHQHNFFPVDIDEKSLLNFMTDLNTRKQALDQLDFEEGKRIQAWALHNLFSEIEKVHSDYPDEMQKAVQDIIQLFNDPVLTLDKTIVALFSCICTKDVGSYMKDLKCIEEGLSISVEANPEIGWTFFEACSTKTHQALQDTCNPVHSENRKVYNRNGGISSTIPDIIQKLNLNEFFPEKLTVQRALEINENTFETPQELQDIPWAILRKIISVDFNFREMVLSEFLQKNRKESRASTKPKQTSILKKLGRPSDSSYSGCYHPLDVFLAIFVCCDAFLKKVLAQKLFACQVAIPFMYKALTSENIILSLWPVRNIVTVTNEGLEESVATMNSTVVSFMKIGNENKISKSKLINEFLRDLNTVHNTFFHRDCPLGVHKRSVSDGMIEIAWFLPERAEQKSQHKKQTDYPVAAQIQQPLTILNLRGDAYVHEKQTQALLQSSSVIVLLINFDDIKHHEQFETNKYRQFLSDIHTSHSKVIILTDLKFDSSEIELFQSAYKQHMNMDELKTAFIPFYDTDQRRDLSRSEIKEMLTECILDALSTASTQNLEKISEKICCDIIFDEQNNQCIAGKQLAQSIADSIFKIDVSVRKDKILPLQGKELWQKWTHIQKERCRSVNPESYMPRNDSTRTMESLRESQINSLNSAPDILATFVEALVVHINDDETILYFLSWLKYYLDDQSRKVLPTICKELHEALSLKEADKYTKKSGETEVANAEKQLVHASLGVEHFFREMGQIYEAFTSTNTKSKFKVGQNTNLLIERLPSIAAKGLILGQPLEILDGDAANVPLQWIKAVFKEVQRYLGNAKCLSIAVLGVQSSGKSTLLNSMFGLQFAVSAGRCTRGIYVQLIKVNDKSLKFNYAMIIDTEGLRAPEMSRQMVRHDNELATFVIGMADIVVINIKGETIADMEDVLQIVVHEMLRLRQAHDNLQLRQSAILVHQNVSAQDADRKVLQGNQGVINNLDKMAQLAADQERMTGIKSFNDVIAFNCSEHVKYIPDLWYGQPPMAPASPRYSRVSADTLSCILNDVTAKHNNFHTFRQVPLLIDSLWNGILAEDFVFSFRNVLEVKAYSLLDEEYQRLKWDLEVKKTTWFNETFLRELAKCNTVGDLKKSKDDLEIDFREMMNTTTKKCIDTLFEFITNSDFCYEMTKWKESKALYLKEVCKDIKQSMKQKIKRHVEQRKSVITEEYTLMQKKEELNNLASKLANQIRLSGKEASKAEINDHFSSQWTKWVNEIPYEGKPVSEGTLKRHITKILEDRYSSSAHLITEGLRTEELDKHKFENGLQGSLDNMIEKEYHVKILDFYVWNNKEEICNASVAVNSIFNDVEIFFEGLLQKDIDYDQGQFSHALKLVTEQSTLKNKKRSSSHFKMTQKMEIMVALQVARYSYQKLLLLKSTYEGKHSLHAQLLKYKPKAEQLFTDIVESKKNEIIASKQLCLELKDIIKEKIELDMPINICTKIKAHFSHQKHCLIKEIMADLAEDDIFSAYMGYITDAELYARQYIAVVTNRIVFDKNNKNRRSYFVTVVEAKVIKIIQAIKEQAAAVTKSIGPNHDVKKWTEMFTHMLDNQGLIIGRGRFRNVINRPVEDFQNFLVCISEQLSDVEKELVKDFENLRPSEIKWPGETPYDTIFDALWGCSETCPFCDEPCQETDKVHRNVFHTCVQHRPIGNSGGKTRNRQKLLFATCNYHVKSNRTIRCGDWCNCTAKRSDVYHLFKQYNKYAPTWNIAPQSQLISSKYWMWFMANHSSKLAKYHDVDMPDIPVYWQQISKMQAIRSLNVYFD